MILADRKWKDFENNWWLHAALYHCVKSGIIKYITVDNDIQVSK